MSRLNSSQKEAVHYYEKNSVVIACPGSGKTKVIEVKVYHILQNDPNAHIQCVTFTKQGAQEMKTRIYKLIPRHQHRQVSVNTFHAVAFRIYRQLHKRPELITSNEKFHLLTDIYRSLEINDEGIGFDEFFSNFSQYLVHRNKDSLNPIYHTARSLYLKSLERSGKTDFDEILRNMNDALEAGTITPIVAKYILVDEGQDADLLMQHWIFLNYLAGKIITILLDDDQTLYSYKHSLGIDIARWAESEIDAKVLQLNENYRSHTEILVPAQYLIDHNKKRQHKQLVPFRGLGGKFQCAFLLDIFEMHNYIVNIIVNKSSDATVGILTRTNADAENINVELVGAGFETHCKTSGSILDAPYVAAYLSLLCALEAEDGLALMSSFPIISGFNEELQAQFINSQKITPDEPTQAVFERLISSSAKVIKAGALKGDKLSNCRSFIKMIETWLSLKYNSTSLMKEIVSYLESILSEDKIRVLESISRSINAIPRNNIRNKIQEFEKRLTKSVTSESTIVLMTAHASKGLAFDHVIVAPFFEGRFPNGIPIQGCETEELNVESKLLEEEERRIAYVAITRAKYSCHLVTYYHHATPTTTKLKAPSRFYSEIGIPTPSYRDLTKNNPVLKSEVLELVIESESFGYRLVDAELGS